MEPYYLESDKKQPVSNRRVGIVLFTPIILWISHLFTAYGLEALACSQRMFMFTLGGLAGTRIILLIITGVALSGLLYSGSIAYGHWRDLTKETSGPDSDPTGQFRFLTFSGVLLAGFLSISMIWYTATILINDLCVMG